MQQEYSITDLPHLNNGLIVNPAAYTHTSVALLDAIKAVGIPTVEVHLSDVSSREEFRKISYVGLAAKKTITGKGIDGYLEAVAYFDAGEKAE